MTIKLNQQLSKTNPEHNDLHEGRIYRRVVVLFGN